MRELPNARLWLPLLFRLNRGCIEILAPQLVSAAMIFLTGDVHLPLICGRDPVEIAIFCRGR